MWWQNFDLAAMGALNKDPVAPPREGPRWGSYAVEGVASAPCSPAGGRKSQARAFHRSNTRAIKSPSAGQRVAFRSALGRPASAPSLLRGEGLIAQQPVLDDFRQEIEDNEVRQFKEVMRRENTETRDRVEAHGRDGLFELRTYHNGLQRARTKGSIAAARPVSAPGVTRKAIAVGPDSHSKAKGCPSQIEDVKDLCKHLDHDIKKHCKRLGLPTNNKDQKGNASPQRMAMFVGLLRTVGQDTMSDKEKVLNELGGGLTLKARFSDVRREMDGEIKKKNSVVPAGITDDEALQAFAEFLYSLCEGIWHKALRRLDARGRGSLRLADWEVALERVGFKGNPAQIFRILDDRRQRVLQVQELEVKLAPFWKRLKGVDSATL